MEWKAGGKWCSAVVSVAVIFPGVPDVSAAVVIPWVSVGDPGNKANSNGFGPGSVGYNYLIGKYDVTNNQYVEFLNTVDQTGSNIKSLYDSRMGNYPGHVDWTGGINFNSSATIGSKYSVKGGQGNLPLVWVSWNSAARFANWLNNGQGDATTESGAYDMTQALPSRTANASVFIPSENEWYKAAYYDPTKDGAGGYWIYAARSDNIPTSRPPPGGSNSANFIEAPSGRYALTGSASRNESPDLPHRSRRV
jgi:sulfatase modifying factor 1